MENLTAGEVKVLNNLSNVHNPAVDLGNQIQDLITRLGIAGTPVNAVNAVMELVVSGVSVDGETVTIGTQKYEFCADNPATKTLPTNIVVDISDHATHASQSLTVDTRPTAGDTMTIGTNLYIFVPIGTANEDGEISIGADLPGAKVNIVAAINGTDGYNVAHPLVTASNFSGNVCTITAKVGGTVGNSIATTETFTAGTNIFGGATLSGGANCSAANTGAELLATINDNDTQGVAATANGNNVVLTADVAGAAANAIDLAETMANGAFTGGAVKMAGGVNGTVGYLERPMVDSTYLYICIAATNTVSGKNWRRISLGSAY